MNQRVGNRRLLKLAEFLKTVPPKRFNYRHWVGWGWKGAADLSCGTTACALGWATTMPTFRRLGLCLISTGSTGYVGLAGRRVEHSLEAAEAVFGLSFEEAYFLFIPYGNLGEEYGPPASATPKQVARHIERFVKSRESA